MVLLFYNFNMFAQNIDCWYTLELPQRGGSNEYQQMCCNKNKENRYSLVNSSCAIYNAKVGYEEGIRLSSPEPKAHKVSLYCS